MTSLSLHLPGVAIADVLAVVQVHEDIAERLRSLMARSTDNVATRRQETAESRFVFSARGPMGRHASS